MTATDIYTVPVRISWEKLANVVTTAFEAGSYGCSYWLPYVECPDDTDPSCYPGSGPWYSRTAYWLDETRMTKFHELTDERENTTQVHEVTRAALYEGIVNLSRLRPDMLAYLADCPYAANHLVLDGPIADVILQIIILGEVRYG